MFEEVTVAGTPCACVRKYPTQISVELLATLKLRLNVLIDCFAFLTPLRSPYLCSHYLPYAIVCHTAVLHSDRKASLKHITSHASTTNIVKPCVTWSVRSEVHENSALLGCYAASSGHSLPTFWDNLSFPSSKGFLTLEDEIDRLSRNVGKELPLFTT